MRMYRILGVLVLLALACAPPVAAQAPKGGFAGKVLVVGMQSSPSKGATLKQVRVERIGGREFLVGTAIDTGHDAEWRADRVVWIALEDVLQIVEFDSLEELKQMRESPESGS